MSETLYSKALSHGHPVKKLFKVKPWGGRLRFDIRDWTDNRPTIKGVSLPSLRWVSLVYMAPAVADAIKKVKEKGREVNFELHIGGNVYITVTSPYWLVDIRQRFVDSEGNLRPTRRGIKLRFAEWKALTETFEEVKDAAPEVGVITPCYLGVDHQNQLGYLSCPECSPKGYSQDTDSTL